MVMRANVGAHLATAEPRPLFRAQGYSRTMFLDRGTSFDVTSDGQRFILRQRETLGRAVLVQNWAARLESPGSTGVRR